MKVYISIFTSLSLFLSANGASQQALEFPAQNPPAQQDDIQKDSLEELVQAAMPLPLTGVPAVIGSAVLPILALGTACTFSIGVMKVGGPRTFLALSALGCSRVVVPAVRKENSLTKQLPSFLANHPSIPNIALGVAGFSALAYLIKEKDESFLDACKMLGVLQVVVGGCPLFVPAGMATVWEGTFKGLQALQQLQNGWTTERDSQQ